MNSMQRLTKRLDGWFNVITGLGRKQRDKRVNADFEWNQFSEDDAEHLYASDDIAAKIIDLLPKEAMRTGFTITGLEKNQVEILEKALVKIGATTSCLKSWILARIYGGCGLFLVTQDLTALSEPLPANVSVTGLLPIQRWELVPVWASVTKDIRHPNFGNPTLYEFYPRMVDGQVTGERIHYSRLIRFDGVELPGKLRRTNSYWGDSVFTRLLNPIRNYQTEHDSAASIVQDYRVGKFKIKNLADMLASDKDQDIIKRLELVRLSKSICSAVVLDAESEDFEYSTGTLTGLDQIIAKAEMRLAAGSRIPHTVLLGESPVGSNATGNSTVLSWYDYVDQERKDYMKPKLLRVVKLKAEELGLDSEKIDIECLPLWQMDEKDQVGIRKTQADADAVYIDRGVVDPHEIAISRFGGEKYSTDTKLENKEREAESVINTEPVRKDGDPTTLGQPIGTIGAGSFGPDGQKTLAVNQVIADYHAGKIPRESALFLLMRSLNLSEVEANQALGEKQPTPSV